MLGGRTRESLAAANKAIDLGERLGLTEQVFFARQVRGVARCELEGSGGLSDLRDALARAVDSGRGQVISVGYNNLGHYLWLLESPRSGLDAKREGIAFSQRRGLLGSARWTQMETIWILFDLGEWDDVLVIHDGQRANIAITRADLEELTKLLLQRTMELTRAVLGYLRSA